MALQIGDKAPEFKIPSDNGDIALSDYKGKHIIIYFYPKDNTPGCTKQACAFNGRLCQFNDLDISIFGISKDSVTKHQKFKTKYNLGYPLLSDESNDVCEQYGVWVEKNMYGRKYMGIERTTFLIDGQGIIQHIWRKVKVANHIDDVIETAIKKVA